MDVVKDARASSATARLHGRVGLIIAIAGILVLIINLVTMPPEVRGLAFHRILVYPQIGGVVLVAGLTLFAAQKSELRLWDVLITAIVGLVATADAASANLTGFVFLLLSVLIAWQYGYLVTRTRTKLAVILILYAGSMVTSVVRSESVRASGVAMTGLAAVVVCGIMWLVVFRGVTKDRQRAAQLERTVAERTHELDKALRTQQNLLLEVHHRTKNNLQIVSSILALEWNRSGELPTDAAVRHTQMRLRALADTHDVLYSKTPDQKTDFAAFVEDFMDRVLTDAHGGPPIDTDIHFNTDVPLDWAIRMALLFNEIILQVMTTNAGEGARRTVSLISREESETARISVDSPLDEQSLRFVQAVAAGLSGSARIDERGEGIVVEIPLPDEAEAIREF